MQHRFQLLLAMLCAAFIGAGCYTSKSFLAESLPDIGLVEIRPNPHPEPVALDFEYGGSSGSEAVWLRSVACKALEETRAFSAILGPEASDVARLEIRMKMRATENVLAAIGKTVVFAITFGLAGMTYKEQVHWNLKWTARGQPPVAKHFEHKAFTVLGNSDGPSGLEPLPADTAQRRLIRALMRVSVRDLQREGKIGG